MPVMVFQITRTGAYPVLFTEDTDSPLDVLKLLATLQSDTGELLQTEINLQEDLESVLIKRISYHELETAYKISKDLGAKMTKISVQA